MVVPAAEDKEVANFPANQRSAASLTTPGPCTSAASYCSSTAPFTLHHKVHNINVVTNKLQALASLLQASMHCHASHHAGRSKRPYTHNYKDPSSVACHALLSPPLGSRACGAQSSSAIR